MTLLLPTLSHGEIEAGFFATFTQFTRLGRYCFLTKHMCDLARGFADNPSSFRGRILGYPLEKFEQRFEDHLSGLLQILSEADEYSSPGAVHLDQDLQVQALQQEVPLEDEIDIRNEAQPLRVEVLTPGKEIIIGEYSLSSLEFGGMALYLANGGHLGWDPRNVPPFAVDLRAAIRSSLNPLYQSIQREMR